VRAAFSMQHGLSASAWSRNSRTALFERRWVRWSAILAFWTLVALFFATQNYLNACISSQAAPHSLTWFQALILAFCEWYVWKRSIRDWEAIIADVRNCTRNGSSTVQPLMMSGNCIKRRKGRGNNSIVSFSTRPNFDHFRCFSYPYRGDPSIMAVNSKVSTSVERGAR